jgi:N-acetylglucosamine malate deacetylase 1
MRLLAITAHPTYAICQCGGTLINHVKNGDEVTIVSLTAGECMTCMFSEKEMSDLNHKELAAAGAVIGVKETRILSIPDTEIIDSVENRLLVNDLIREIKPDVIMTHWGNDSHPDVQAVAHLVSAATMFCQLTQGKWVKNYPPHKVGKLYAFEIAGYSRNFDADVLIDVSKCMEQKIKAMLCFKTHIDTDCKGDTDRFLNMVLIPDRRWGFEPGTEYAEPYRHIKTHETHDQAVQLLPL